MDTTAQPILATSRGYVTIRFHEIALKGRNRPFFIRQLVENIRHATTNLGVERVWSSQLRVALTISPNADWEPIRGRLTKVFGIVKFALGYSLPPSIERVEELLAQLVPQRSFASFRITARRNDKSFPMTSLEIDRRVGAFVQRLTSATVDLKHPELNIHVEILPREATVYFDEVPGPGGLPVGVSGKALALMSGGIDSPVSVYRIMKRGCQVSLVHFHSFPLVEGRSREKAVELAELLTGYQYRTRLYLVPFASLQQQVILSIPPAFRVVIYRRFMLRIAQAIAQKEGAKALVTGESLGQVSSQTLENMATIEAVANMPILRPLVGMDKQEITDEARSIGTYPISIQPDEDCCSLFISKHPATRSTAEQMEAMEQSLDVQGLVDQAVAQAEVREFSA